MSQIALTKINTQAAPTSFLIPQQSSQSLFVGLSNGIVEKFDLRKPTKVCALEISQGSIVGIVSLDQNSVVTADVNGGINEIDIRSNGIVRSVTLKDYSINAIGIIRPSCLLVGTQRNFQVLFSNQLTINIDSGRC